MQKIQRQYDLLIIGGGPAGATLGTLVKKYNPSVRVAIVEMEDFPRHHVGESLLPAVPPILREMGVFEEIAGAGFPKKLGGTYVWGRSRAPWTADFEGLTPEQRLGMSWDKLDSAAYSWQVRRAKYDHILLEHARKCGVEIIRGRAESVLESGGRIAGAKVALAGGPDVEISSHLSADCSGQRGFLSKFRAIREFDERLQNVAMYAYFRGAPWRTKFIGHPDKTRIFICSVSRGWFWYIPIGEDIVSVGLVTTGEHLRENRIKDLRAFFAREIKACPEIGQLLASAEWVGDFDSTGKDFFTAKDWSYLCRQAAGPGWLAAGDAAVFVDPVFSSGVTIAHLSA
ncbi:MAG TPA: tryptophan 7-halogenase [Elusimicrobiota bacterium]|nr:tryptophan 7-halogenase [Elusimicrobiota bacterium]